MRLIDADKLESVDFSECTDLMEIMNVIDAQPTAYDADAVVEQLEERKSLHKSMIEYEHKNGTIADEYQARKAVEVLDKAIEIVKGGGVDAKTDS